MTERYPIRRLLPGAGYQQLAAAVIALIVIVFVPGPVRLIFATLLALAILVRVLDRGYVELGPSHVTVMGYFYTRIRYEDIADIVPFEPRWEGWFGRLNKTLLKGIERIDSAESIAANWPDYAIALKRPKWVLTFFPLPLPLRKRRIYLTIEGGDAADFSEHLRKRLGLQTSDS